ncbi:hypothetical protein Tco_0529053 [Tanacetum coccineum]
MNSLKVKGLHFMSFCSKRIGNGNSTNFWLDIWKGDSAFCELFPRVYALESVKDISVASKMAMQMDSSFRRPARGGIELSQLNDLISFTCKWYSLSSVPEDGFAMLLVNGVVRRRLTAIATKTSAYFFECDCGPCSLRGLADGGSWIGIFGRLFQAGIHGFSSISLGVKFL